MHSLAVTPAAVVIFIQTLPFTIVVYERKKWQEGKVAADAAAAVAAAAGRSAELDEINKPPPFTPPPPLAAIALEMVSTKGCVCAHTCV